ncbi:hypothetical protein H0H93_015351, partial [Arthromyces matolae]
AMQRMAFEVEPAVRSLEKRNVRDYYTAALSSLDSALEELSFQHNAAVRLGDEEKKDKIDAALKAAVDAERSVKQAKSAARLAETSNGGPSSHRSPTSASSSSSLSGSDHARNFGPPTAAPQPPPARDHDDHTSPSPNSPGRRKDGHNTGYYPPSASRTHLLDQNGPRRGFTTPRSRILAPNSSGRDPDDREYGSKPPG